MTPDLLLDLIRRFEGCRLTAYLCPAGVWTVGWGATGPDIQQGTAWTREQADARLIEDAERYYRAAGAISPALWTEPARHVAIADFCYNLGTTRYRASTLRRRVDTGDWPGAAEEISKWVWAAGRKLPGLVLRRAAEAALL
jgi:lysozyme